MSPPQIKFTKLFINNEWVSSKSGKKMPVINPSTGEKIAEVDEALPEDVDVAVAAAKAAFHRKSPWRTMDASERGRLLSKLADAIERDIENFAALDTLEMGKPISLAKNFSAIAIQATRYYAGLADKTHGKTIPVDGKAFSYTREEPVGVCGLIVPWNGSLVLSMNKLAPCLAAGNTAILKSSEKTPLVALYLASLIKEVGFPPGVVNIISGFGPTAGSRIASHPDIDLVSFTGSTVTGTSITKAAAESNGKRVRLEMGGKSPFVICEDADLDMAAMFAHEGCMMNMGQACCAATRCYVHEKIYDAFVQKVVALAKNRKIGDPFDPTVAHGPQVDDLQFNRVLSYIEKGKTEGATIVTGGNKWGNKGYYVEPTIFTDVKDDMTIAREEIFGPVQCIFKYSDFDEVIDRCNDTKYGLAAGIMTPDVNKIIKFTQTVRAGTIWVNNFLHFGVQTPFGGFRMSGQGREMGEDGIKDYLEIKTVTIMIPEKCS